MNSWRPRLATSLLILTSLVSAAVAAPKVGEVFPDLKAFGLEGTAPDLKGKVVLVDFWASWCGPCRHSFPALQEIHSKFKGKGVVVLGISLDEDKGDMDKFLRKSKTEFPILRDAKGKLAEKLEVSTIPSSFLLAPDGKILAIHSGYAGDQTKREYIAEIEKALPKP